MNNLFQGLFVGLLALSLIIVGCGGPDFGGDIRVSAGKQHTLKSSAVSGKLLTLPADTEYNIHIKKSSQNPGPDGQARGDSNATSAGEASGMADASNGGAASAEFNIGHRIDNKTDTAQTVAVDITYSLVQTLKANKIPDSETKASINLHLVIRDSKKKILAKTTLVQSTSDEALAGGNTQDQRNLSVQFEPGLSYDIMLYGKVDASSSAGQMASAKLDIKSLNMKLLFTPTTKQAEKK